MSSQVNSYHLKPVNLDQKEGGRTNDEDGNDGSWGIKPPDTFALHEEERTMDAEYTQTHKEPQVLAKSNRGNPTAGSEQVDEEEGIDQEKGKGVSHNCRPRHVNNLAGKS